MNTRQQYIDKYKQLAVDSTVGTGLFPSVQLAQGIVESNNGNSVLASKYNNHFGIKAQYGDGWTGKVVDMSTREVVNGVDTTQGAYFRVYDNAADSFKDRVKFLKENERYASHGVFTAPSPLGQLKALQAAGYATDPNYASIINSILTENQLTMLDTAIAVAKKYWLVLALGISAIATGIYLFNKAK